MHRRDYILLPLLSLMTVVTMFGLGTLASDLYWPEPQNDACLYFDVRFGPLDEPNCRSQERIPESPETTNVFNACGYRQTTPCGPKAPGSLRIVMFGSSIAEGLLVPMDQTAATLVEREMTRRLGRRVEVQQLSTALQSPLYALHRIPEALKLNPDVVILMITPIDVELLEWIMQRAHEPGHDTPAAAAGKPKMFSAKSIQTMLADSTVTFSLEHLMFQNRDLFVRLYLTYGDKADFLRQPFTPAWETRFKDLDSVIARMSQELGSANVPLFVTATPSRANAALLRSSLRPLGVDPFAWGRKVCSISKAHGAVYIDMLSAFQSAPDADAMYYPVDGHMNAKGQPVMSRALIDSLNANEALWLR